jgi:uncharacterized protein YkwD
MQALACVGLLPVVVAAPAPPPAASAGVGASDAERKEAKRLLEKYRDAAFDPIERRMVIDDAVKLSRPVRETFLKIVDEDVAKALPAYRNEFKTAADALAVVREGKAAKEEMKRLRAEILALGRLGGALTKEKIQSVGDPALAKLKGYFRFDRQMVLDSAPGIKINRERLVGLLTCRENLRRSLAVNDGKDFPPEKVGQEEEAASKRPPPYDRDAVKAMEANEKLASNLPAEEFESIRITNEMRAMLGISVLAIDVKLCEAARGHSKDMVEYKFFAHESPVPGKKTPWDRAKLAGTSAGAENIYAGSAKPADPIGAWFHSPGHHVNMLNPGHKRIGMGRHGGHWTQMFG